MRHVNVRLDVVACLSHPCERQWILRHLLAIFGILQFDVDCDGANRIDLIARGLLCRREIDPCFSLWSRRHSFCSNFSDLGWGRCPSFGPVASLLPALNHLHVGCAAAPRSAPMSNLLGIVVTPVLVSSIMGDAGKYGCISLASVEAIPFQLLVPFMAGYLLRPLIGEYVVRQKLLVTVVDRGSILLVVYLASAFSLSISSEEKCLLSESTFFTSS